MMQCPCQPCPRARRPLGAMLGLHHNEVIHDEDEVHAESAGSHLIVCISADSSCALTIIMKMQMLKGNNLPQACRRPRICQAVHHLIRLLLAAWR